MGPRDREELEIWTRAVVAASVDFSVDSAAARADAVLNEWRLRRDAVEAAELEADEAERAGIRAALNAAPWEYDGEGGWTRYALGFRDDANPGRRRYWLFGLDHVTSKNWPEGFGDPPPGWGTP